MKRLNLSRDHALSIASYSRSARVAAFEDPTAPLSTILDSWAAFTRVLESIARTHGLSDSWVALHPISRLFAHAVGRRDVIPPRGEAEGAEILDRVADLDPDPWGDLYARVASEVAR